MLPVETRTTLSTALSLPGVPESLDGLPVPVSCVCHPGSRTSYTGRTPRLSHSTTAQGPGQGPPHGAVAYLGVLNPGRGVRLTLDPHRPGGERDVRFSSPSTYKTTGSTDDTGANRLLSLKTEWPPEPVHSFEGQTVLFPSPRTTRGTTSSPGVWDPLESGSRTKGESGSASWIAHGPPPRERKEGVGMGYFIHKS